VGAPPPLLAHIFVKTPLFRVKGIYFVVCVRIFDKEDGAEKLSPPPLFKIIGTATDFVLIWVKMRLTFLDQRVYRLLTCFGRTSSGGGESVVLPRRLP